MRKKIKSGIKESEMRSDYGISRHSSGRIKESKHNKNNIFPLFFYALVH